MDYVELSVLRHASKSHQPQVLSHCDICSFDTAATDSFACLVWLVCILFLYAPTHSLTNFFLEFQNSAAPQGKSEMTECRKKRGREVPFLCLQAVQSQCCRWVLERETVWKRVSSLLLFSISLLKELISWGNHMGLFIWTSVLLPLFKFSIRASPFLEPHGGSDFSCMTV